MTQGVRTCLASGAATLLSACTGRSSGTTDQPAKDTRTAIVSADRAIYSVGSTNDSSPLTDAELAELLR